MSEASSLKVWDELLENLSTLSSKTGSLCGEQDDHVNMEQIELGQDLFDIFFQLFLALRAENKTVKLSPKHLIEKTMEYVTENQIWIQSFIFCYSLTQIELDGAMPTELICQVRSGIQFLLEDFSGISTEFDNVISNLKLEGEIDDFDNHLQIWRGFRYPIMPPEGIPPNTPAEHWWWF